MVKHTQTVRRQNADEMFENVWPFCGVGAERVNSRKLYEQSNWVACIQVGTHNSSSEKFH